MAYQEGSEQQEILEKQQPSKLVSTTTKEQIEKVEQKILGTKLHRKFEVLDPIMEKPVVLAGIVILIALVIILIWKKWKKSK